MSDSDGYIIDRRGIDLDLIKELKEVERKRISEYVTFHPEAEYHEGCSGVWNVKCDIALPCATQNELDEEAAKALIANGVTAVCEGANMPSTPEAIAQFQKTMFSLDLQKLQMLAVLLLLRLKCARTALVIRGALKQLTKNSRALWKTFIQRAVKQLRNTALRATLLQAQTSQASLK